MQRKSFSGMTCPVARGLDRVGEWWSILILRDAFAGISRFDDFQQSLGIAPTMLTRRLHALVENGLLQRRRYNEHPPRDEYVLTERGLDFRPVLIALMAWGNRHFAPEGATIQIIDSQTKRPAEPVMVDRITGRALVAPDYMVAPGPAANDATRRRIARGSQLLGAAP